MCGTRTNTYCKIVSQQRVPNIESFPRALPHASKALRTSHDCEIHLKCGLTSIDKNNQIIRESASISPRFVSANEVKGLFMANITFVFVSILCLFSFVFTFLRCRYPSLFFSPVNLVDSYENRFAFACAFGATTSKCLTILFLGTFEEIFSPEFNEWIQRPEVPSFTASKKNEF